MRKRKGKMYGIIVAICLVQSVLAGCASTETLQQNMQKQLDTESISESTSELPTEQAVTETYIDASSAEKLTEEDYKKYKIDDKEAATEEKAGAAPNNTMTSADTDQNKQDQNKQDQYETDPVPEGKPDPVEPDEAIVDDTVENTCTIYIECGTILTNIDQLDPAKSDLVPEDGVILEKETVTFYEGESVFDVLLRETQNHRIHMEYSFTPVYNSSYIEGINNLYEFDCGELSGWMYSVNGWYPNYGCSRYQVQAGDTIEWHYTCDLGRDLGQTFEEQ